MGKLSRVFILGAGCSRNYSEGTSSIQGLKCPLDSDFFKMAKKVILNRKNISSPFYSGLDHLLKDLKHLYGINPENELDLFDDERLSLETVLTLLQLREELLEENISQFGILVTLPHYKRRLATLVELISYTIDESLKGPICSTHKKLAKSMKNEDYVINFNYDILMELALRKISKFTDEGYIVSFYNVYNGAEWEPPQSSISPIKVAKLHGSLNWLKCQKCNSLLLLRNQKVGNWYESLPNVNTCIKCNSTIHQMERVIIPPMLIKNYQDPNIHYLWSASYEALRNADEIVIIGYSMPSTDYACETLLRDSLGKRQNNIPTIIVNPDITIKKHYSKIFNGEKIVQYKSLEEYLNSS